MCAAVFYLRPRDSAEEEILRSRAQVNNTATQDLPGGPGYAPAWVRNVSNTGHLALLVICGLFSKYCL